MNAAQYNVPKSRENMTVYDVVGTNTDKYARNRYLVDG